MDYVSANVIAFMNIDEHQEKVLQYIIVIFIFNIYQPKIINQFLQKSIPFGIHLQNMFHSKLNQRLIYQILIY